MKSLHVFPRSWSARISPFAVLSAIIVLALVLSGCSGFPSPAAAAQSNPGAVPNTGAVAGTAAASTPSASPAAPTAQPVQSTPLAAAKGPKAYIGLFKDNAVAVLDTGTNQVLRTIPVPAGPHGLVISPDDRRVYVSSDGDSTVSVIDTSTDTVVQSIQVGKTPHGLALTPDGRLLLAAVFGTNQVVFIDTATQKITGQAAVLSPHNIAISPDGRQAYVASQKQGAAGLAVLNIAQKTQTAFFPLGKAPRALNFSPDGKQLYFTQAGVDSVQALDPATNQISAQIPVGASPHHPLFTPDGSMALVVSQGPGELYFLEPQHSLSFFSLKVGKMPHWIAVNDQGTTAWVTDEGSNDVSIVDLTKFAVTATIPVGSAPRKIVVQHGSGQAGQNTAGMKTAINGMAFADAAITIKAGESITWVNNDSIAHSVTADQGQWDSGPIQPGQSYTLTLKQPGKYGYHCSIHPFMQASVMVNP